MKSSCELRPRSRSGSEVRSEWAVGRDPQSQRLRRPPSLGAPPHRPPASRRVGREERAAASGAVRWRRRGRAGDHEADLLRNRARCRARQE